MAASKDIIELQHKVQLLEEKNNDLKARVKTLSVDHRDQSFLIESLMENTPFGLMMVDGRRRVIRMNRAAESILNVPRNVAVGRQCEYIFDCYKQKDSCPALDHNDVLDRLETKCTVKGQEGKTLLRSSVLAKHLQEDILIESFVDITEIKDAQDAVIKASRAKDEFLAKMSHELRTPLNAIIGFSELIKDDIAATGSEEMIEYLGSIGTAGHDLLHLVNEVLDISKINANMVNMELRHIEVQSFIAEIEKLVQPLIEKNNNRFSITVSDDVTTVYADQYRLRQILNNLISNACKFTFDGDISIRVTSGDSGETPVVKFSVKDTGIGMTAEQAERVFKEFEQADNTTTRKYGGAGLGLPIAKQLSMLMHGDIAVDSQEGKGSTFTLFLPEKSPD